jgi:hypothetical protein
VTPLGFAQEAARCFMAGEHARGALACEGLWQCSEDPTKVGAYAMLVDAVQRLDFVLAADLLEGVIGPALEPR